MSVRRLAPGDADAAARVHAACFDGPWSATELATLLADAAVVGLGLWEVGELAGFVLARTAADEAEILTLAVAPDARRRGGGAALVDSAISAARRRGAGTLFLEVAADNVAALALYHRFGFTRSAVRPDYYARPDGARTDAVLMKRSLNTGAG